MRYLAYCALACSALLILSTSPVLAGGTWLDAGSASWNKPGAALPHAEPATSGNLARCGSELRSPETAADHAVAAAGWKLYGPYQLYGGTAIVMAESDADGMCRPEGYQAFVFVHGAFAGTLAPKAMSARSDGSFQSAQLFGATSFNADFERYTESDPLCCPSRTTTVTFKVVRKSGHSVVVASDISTSKNSGN
jgi:hypothetical protein